MNEYKARIMDDTRIEIEKAKIDQMTHEQMARLWRFSGIGHPYFDLTSPLWEHFNKRWTAFGGWNPQLSKLIGWEE